MSKAESGPRHTGKHPRPAKLSGAHLTEKQPELTKAKPAGAHGKKREKPPKSTGAHDFE